jgi:hypothetical protein
MIKLVETENVQTVDPPADVASNIKSMYELGRVLLTQPEDDDNGSMHVPARPLREVLCTLGTTPELKLSSKFYLHQTSRTAYQRGRCSRRKSTKHFSTLH